MQNIQYIKVPFPEAVNTFGFSDGFLCVYGITGIYQAIPFANDNFDLYLTGGGAYNQLFFSGSGSWNGSGFTSRKEIFFFDSFNNYATGSYFTGCIALDSGALRSGYSVLSNRTGITLNEINLLFDELNLYSTGYDQVGSFTGAKTFSGCSTQETYPVRATKGGEAYFRFDYTGGLNGGVSVNSTDLLDNIIFDVRINKIPSGCLPPVSGGQVFAALEERGFLGILSNVFKVLQFSGFDYNSGFLFSSDLGAGGASFVSGLIPIETGVWKTITGFWAGAGRIGGNTYSLNFAPLAKNTSFSGEALTESGRSVVDVKNIKFYDGSYRMGWNGSQYGSPDSDIFTTGYVFTNEVPVLLL